VRTYRLILSGLGNVGRSFLELLQSQADLLAHQYDISFVVTGAADTSGAALAPDGLDVAALIAAKNAKQGVGTLSGVGQLGMSAIELAKQAPGDLLLESTLTNLRDGQPGLDVIRTALTRKIHVVSANKGPIVLAFDELTGLASQPGGPDLRYSACVGGALPSVNIGRRDMAGARIERIEAVLNGTTQLILRLMESVEGTSFEEALAEAQRRGVAEADPTLDVEGWDAANKLTILANAVLRQPTRLADLSVTGIRGLMAADLLLALEQGTRIILLCLAERVDEHYRLSVGPTALPLDHPLARMSGEEMGIVYHTDIAGRSSATSAERGPMPTAAAMLRDILDLVSM
jgi:homoserine dehydrogenase